MVRDLAAESAGPVTAGLRVDFIACDGSGLRAEMLPELITLDGRGFPIVSDGAVPRYLLAGPRRRLRPPRAHARPRRGGKPQSVRHEEDL